MLRTVALPLKGNEFQANHNSTKGWEFFKSTVALPLKGNEFQANHNMHTHCYGLTELLLYLSKVTNFKQITTIAMQKPVLELLLLYLSKVTNFKQITTCCNAYSVIRNCCFTSQR